MKIDKVAIIKDRVNMRDVLSKYGYMESKRMKCPLHNGDDKNFEVKEKGWVCYSRCGSGDVISFVQRLFGLSFVDALRKIDSDFHLGLYEQEDFEKLKRLQYKQKAEEAKRLREKKEKEKAENEYWNALKEWVRLDTNRRIYKPSANDEELHPLFVEAIMNIKHQEFIVDRLDERRLNND